MKRVTSILICCLLANCFDGVHMQPWYWPGTFCYTFCPKADHTSIWQKRCYTYVPDIVNGKQAETGCVSRGGHLASINSESEQDFVYEFWQNSLVRHTPANINANSMNSLWIGASKSGGNWGWTDGSSWGYSKWERTYGRQPDGTGDCAHMWTHSRVQPPGGWNDVWCERSIYRWHYMCEKAGIVACYPFKIDWLKEWLFPDLICELNED